MCTCLHIGIVVEHLISVTWFAFVTPLPIELACNVTGVVVWRVNNKYYTLTDLTNGVLTAHRCAGTNILVYGPLKNAEYVCVSTTNDGGVRSDPAYIIITSK